MIRTSPSTWRSVLPPWGVMSVSLHLTTTSCIVWTETGFTVSGNKGKRRTFSSHICLKKKTHICFAVNVQHDADEVFLSILNSTLLQIDDGHLVGFWSHLFCTAQIRFPLWEFPYFCLFRHVKSRTYTRFPQKHSCSVWSAAPSRLSPAICSTCHCTSKKLTILWCFLMIYSFVHLCGLCFF